MAVAVVALGVFGTAPHAVAQQEKVIYGFPGIDPVSVYEGVISDSSGNLYGTTYAGGVYLQGSVYELSPKAGGGWTERVLHSFNQNGKRSGGCYVFSGLVFDKIGNLYGTTVGCGAYNAGTVFELSPNGGGPWKLTVLYNFSFEGRGGYLNFASLVFDTAGNLYGTTTYGGDRNSGTVFELTPTAAGWTETVLHSFNDDGTDGVNPYASPVFDSGGNLYGTTIHGGAYGYGTVFELKPMSGGRWAEEILHDFNFNGIDGAYPFYSGVSFDAFGNLYGTTAGGGAYGNLSTGVGGTVFEMTPMAGGTWTEAVLYSFGNGTDGSGPVAGVILDSAGNLYGTTIGGGAYNVGIAYELVPSGGQWTKKLLHVFGHLQVDGYEPYGGNLILDSSGNLYGTTLYGGPHGNGAVFEITP